ncbi:MAG: hypothetical protein ACI379_01520 [Nocardioides sp.]|uniref:hypothetical protein n=1 Tax=Nocardioides sp. TaxID=35761 RepID=UPI003F030FF9
MVLHVGTMKSGTTFLQSRLFAHRDHLLESGVTVPAPDWRHMVGAVNDVLRTTSGRFAWTELVEAVRAHPGTSVVSMEYLGPAGPRSRQRILDSLEGLDLTVVVTARDLNRQIPAMWQERLQNGGTAPLAAYADAVRATRRSAPTDGAEHPYAELGRAFWRHQALDRVVRRWAEAVGPDRVVLVTVPPPGASTELLWERFASVLGVPAGGLGDLGADHANASLGAASAAVLLRVNELLEAQGMGYPVGQRLRKQVLAKMLLAGHRAAEPRIGHPVPGWVQRTSERMVRRTAGSSVRVVGDLQDLRPVAVPGTDPAEVAGELVADAATTALADLVAHEVRANAAHEAGTRPTTRDSSTGDVVGTREQQ